MKRVFRFIFRAVEVVTLLLVVFLLSLFFRAQRLPDEISSRLLNLIVPPEALVQAEGVSFGFRQGLSARNVRAYFSSSGDPSAPMVSASCVSLDVFRRRLEVSDLVFSRLPANYYRPGNVEKNEAVEMKLPDVAGFSLVLTRPSVLGIRPERVSAEVGVSENCLSVDDIRLIWPDAGERMSLTGFCKVDFARQRVTGEVRGSARQAHIRPLIVALDVPVALPYMDAFTDVPGKVPAFCGWEVNLVNNDFDLDLDLKPTMGLYRLVPFSRAEGKIHLHVYTRGNSLNYRQTFGPIVGYGAEGETLSGTVLVSGTNGYNTVDVDAKSVLPVAELLRIGGFTGNYVDGDVFGTSECRLQFRFPRAMTNNYEVLNGEGHLRIHDGQIMRLKGFRGLIALMAEKVPGVSYLTDTTQASCDYTIENGVLKTENVYIEGSVFSIKMYGTFDAVRDELDFTARVQFTKKDSTVGKILHPLTWPFTKLLLEFRLRGKSSAPQWEYLSVVDRVLEAFK